MESFAHPASLADTYDPIRNEQSRESSLAGAMNMAQAKASMADSQNQQLGLATLYKNLAPQKDETGKLQRSRYVDPATGSIDWGSFLSSAEGNEWAQKYPQVATVIMEKAGIMGGGTATGANAIPINSPEDKARVIALAVTPTAKLAADALNIGDVAKVTTKGGKIYGVDTVKETPETKYERLAAKSAQGRLTPNEQAEMAAIEKYNKTIKPMTTIAGFEGKEKFNVNQLVQTFENPKGSYRRGDKEGRFTTTGIIAFSEALAKGQTIDEFANSQSSSRGVMGTEGKNYLKRAYADYLSTTVKDKDGRPMNPSKIGAYLSSRGNAFKANLQTQKKATDFATLNNRAVAQMDNMANILDSQMSALTASGTKPQAMLNAWSKGAWNDPKYGSFLVAMNSYLSEYMKVVSGGALSVQAITDSARTTGKELLSSSDSQESLKAKLDVMHQEVMKVKETWDGAVETTYGAGALTDIGSAPPTSAPEKGAPAGGDLSTHVWQ